MAAPKKELHPALIRTIAIEYASGKSERELEAEFQVSRFLIKKALRSEEGKTIQKDLADNAIESARNKLRTGMSELADLATKVIKKELEDGNIQAVAYVYKALAIETQEQGKIDRAPSLTVVLPGAVAPESVEKKTIEVESGEVN